MCGITGLIYFDKSRTVPGETLRRMTDSLIHRGPDDEGFYCVQNVGLGFRRLSIIDLHTGHQPLCSDDGSIQLVFNGEIYNYQEQQHALKQKGYTFHTTSDTEVILRLYEAYGTDCVRYLRGMFAFAIWDLRKQRLFCARDRFGIKPFYYYLSGDRLVFGSEIKAVLQSGAIDRTLSPEALDSYFTYGYITGDLSVFQHIRKLPPAHTLTLEGSAIRIDRYWRVEFRPDYGRTETEWAEAINECLSDTVRRHMISDVPLGAFLSGGIDSSSVVQAMARQSDRPVKTFSIGFKEQAFNELRYAREVATRYGCEHHEEIVEPESIGLLPRLVGAYDEPFADASAIPTYYVSRFARRHVTVALSGDGGDELFAGYNSYAYFQKVRKLAFSSTRLNDLVWGNIHRLTPETSRRKSLTYSLAQERDASGAQATFWTKPERRRLMPDSFADHARAERLKEQILGVRGNDWVTRLQHLDMETYMVDDILTKVDRASMLNSLEVRVPLLDHVFAELSFQIPWNLKLKGRAQKYILRKAVSRHLPESILGHPKQGFAVPLSAWFRDNLKDYVQDTLLSCNPRYTRYLDQNYVRRTLDFYYNSGRDLSARIWSLLFFEEWLKQNG